MPKKYLSKKALYSASFLVLALFLFGFCQTVSAAGLVPCGTGSNDPCTTCHLIVGIKGLIDWGLGILITLSLTAISIAGVIYVISSGSPELTTKAKNFVVSAIIGFTLMLSAWLIINVTLWLFSAKGDLGLEGKNWYTFTCTTQSSSLAGATLGLGGVPITGDTVTCSNMTFQTGDIATQCNNGDASDELMALLTCMYSKLENDPKALMINSISDNNDGASCYENNPTWPKCAKDADKDCCHHATTSCHYGGTTCAGKSYAVDIGTGSTASSSKIKEVATACNANTPLDEGSHIHVSVKNSCGCK